MNHVMKKLILPPLTVLLAGALYFPALAQEEGEGGPAAASVPAVTEGGPAHSRKKKTPAKMKTAKKKKAPSREPASEYKFQSQDSPLSYTFDKKGDPIVKKKSAALKTAKKKKRAAGGAKQTAERPLPKLSKPAGSAARYVCPMGEYEGDTPGTCPKCGMTLVGKT